MIKLKISRVQRMNISLPFHFNWFYSVPTLTFMDGMHFILMNFCNLIRSKYEFIALLDAYSNIIQTSQDVAECAKEQRVARNTYAFRMCDEILLVYNTLFSCAAKLPTLMTPSKVKSTTNPFINGPKLKLFMQTDWKT